MFERDYNLKINVKILLEKYNKMTQWNYGIIFKKEN